MVASGSRLTSSLPPLSRSFVGSSDPHACLWTIQNTFRNWGSSSDNQVASSEAGLRGRPRRNPNPIVSESVAFPAEKGVRERGKGISSPPNDDYPGAFFSEGRNEGYQGGKKSPCTFFATCGTFDTLDRLQVLLQMRYCIGGI